MRTGILGGTFDPVHRGHLGMARAARAALELKRVLLVPCARPPHKEREELTDPYHRFAMLALATAGEPGVALATLELRRGGRSFTVDTIREIGAGSPGDDLYLVMGSDSFAEMTTWRDHEEILTMAAVAIAPRPGHEPDRIAGSLPPELRSILLPPGSPWPERLHGRLPLAGLLPAAPLDVSSTEIRRRIRGGERIDGMVPDLVERYIRQHELYA